ncbi:MAG: hypothetical protein AB1467_03335 [Candidatus Diapherotrites archaeon]
MEGIIKQQNRVQEQIERIQDDIRKIQNEQIELNVRLSRMENGRFTKTKSK